MGSINRIIYGVNTIDLDVAGHSVAAVREQAEDLLNIDPSAQARVNGQAVPDDHVIQSGEAVEFAKMQGEKG